MMLQPRAVTSYLPAVNQILDEHLSLMDSKIDRATGEVANFNNEMVKLTMESKSWQNTTPSEANVNQFHWRRTPTIWRSIHAANAKYANDLYILHVKFNLILMHFVYVPDGRYFLSDQVKKYSKIKNSKYYKN